MDLGPLGRDHLDAAELVAWDPDDFAKQMAGPPALHRYPGSMALRIKAVCAYLVDAYGGDAGALWRESAQLHRTAGDDWRATVADAFATGGPRNRRGPSADPYPGRGRAPVGRVVTDLLGCSDWQPKHARPFANLRETVLAATRAYAAQVGDGSVEVVVPDDATTYRVDVRADNGNETSDVPTDPASPRTSTVRTSNGSATVRTG